MFGSIPRWWRRRQRRIDKQLLFTAIASSCRRAFPETTEENRAAIIGSTIAEHVYIDRAWRYPQEWRDEEPEIYAMVEMFKAREARCP